MARRDNGDPLYKLSDHGPGEFYLFCTARGFPPHEHMPEFEGNVDGKRSSDAKLVLHAYESMMTDEEMAVLQATPRDTNHCNQIVRGLTTLVLTKAAEVMKEKGVKVPERLFTGQVKMSTILDNVRKSRYLGKPGDPSDRRRDRAMCLTWRAAHQGTAPPPRAAGEGGSQSTLNTARSPPRAAALRAAAAAADAVADDEKSSNKGEDEEEEGEDEEEDVQPPPQQPALPQQPRVTPAHMPVPPDAAVPGWRLHWLSKDHS